MRWAILLSPLVIIATAALLYTTKSTTAVSVYDLASIPTYVPMDPISLNLALDDALIGTDYYRQWTLNALNPQGGLRIYIFDSSDSAVVNNNLANYFRNNAGYLSELNVITIDYQLVHELWQRYYSNDESYGSRSAVMGWIVGHEVGHLVAGDGVSHFQEGDLLQRRSGCGGDRREIAADEYYVERVITWDQSFVDDRIQMFTHMLTQELAQASNRIEQPARFRRLLWPWHNRCSQPEYLMRALRFIEGAAPYGSDSTVELMTDSLRRELGLRSGGS